MYNYKILFLPIYLLFSLSISYAQHQLHQVGNNSTNIGIVILNGDKVESGFGLYYTSLSSEEDSNFETGFGLSINYFDVKNFDDGLKGSFFSYSPQFAINYYLNDGPFRLQIGGTILLVLGSETIKGYTTTTNFFIGPQFKETVGIMLANTICFKAGLFQLRHFGSELLPSDTGTIFGFDVSF